MATESKFYAEPKKVTSLDECNFYHSVELPEHGLIEGFWDLRGREEVFLGGVSVAGKRVLEIGTADGQLAFDMEKRGAEVVGYDLSDGDEYDIVPFGGRDDPERRAGLRDFHSKLNNAWWFMNGAFGSAANVVYGSVYDVPPELGPFDVSTISTVLLHLRDPFLAMQRVGEVTTETLIVTEVVPGLVKKLRSPVKRVLRRLGLKYTSGDLDYVFLPRASETGQYHTWWNLSPSVIVRYLRILGFPHTSVTYHDEYCVALQKMESLYTVVGHREAPD